MSIEEKRAGEMVILTQGYKLKKTKRTIWILRNKMY